MDMEEDSSSKQGYPCLPRSPLPPSLAHFQGGPVLIAADKKKAKAKGKKCHDPF